MRGIITALVTPFQNGQVDKASLIKLVQLQLNAGVSGLVVNGTTAESPTLYSEEVESIFRIVKSEVGNQIPILVGTGSNSTSKTVELSRQAQGWGCSGLLLVTPYYNKPTQKGLIKHFQTVAESVDVPIMLYNVPGRTITELECETLAKLSSVPNITALKEATGDLKFGAKIKEEVALALFSGDDFTCFDLMDLGGVGVVSVISNLVPKTMVEFANEVFSKGSTQGYKRYQKLLELLYCEPNPTPTKMALYQMGLISSPEMRLPLMKMTLENTRLLTDELQNLELL